MKRNKCSVKMLNNRSAVNRISVLVAFVFLCFAIVTADVTFTKRIKDISKGLGRALNIILEENEIVYTNYTDESRYFSKAEFHPKGMAGLYNITHIFMDFIQPKEVFPSDLELTDSSGSLQVDKIIAKWPSVIRHYAGILIITILGLLFAAFMPLTGFCFCCCRCCGRCGARSQPFDKKHDMCRKVLLAMFLICVATLMLFGVVCAFVSNQHLQDGTEELPDNLRSSVTDMKTFINSTDTHMGVLMVKNFEELFKFLTDILEKCGTILAEDLNELSNAASFSRLELFVTGLNLISKNLTTMGTSTKELRIKASQLNDGLRRVKYELLQTLKSCREQFTECDNINNQVAQLSTTVDFDSLPDVSQEITDLQSIINSDLLITIQKANEEFKQIPEKIQNEVNKNIPEIEDALRKAGDNLHNVYSDMSKLLRQVDSLIDSNTKEPLNQASFYIKEYSVYRYYAGLCLSSVLLFVIICVTFGLMCGICGKRPDGYDDDCCNKGAGGKFLMLGVAVMFLFSIVLMVAMLVYFITGVVMQRLICDTLRNNETEKPNQVFKLLDDLLQLKNLTHNDLETVVRSCHANQTAYNVLRLDYQFNVSNIDQYWRDTKIPEKIDEFVNKINFNPDINIYNTTKDQIEKLKTSSIADMPIHRFVDILDNNLTNINLNDLAERLAEVRIKLEQKPDSDEFVMSIKQNEMYLRTYQNNLVDPMVTIANDLKEKAQGIDDGLKFNETNLSEAITKTLNEVKRAEDFINGKGVEQMRELAKNFGTSFSTNIKLFLDRISISTRDEVGQCGPLSNVYNQTLIATCDKILNPWNGFWMSVGWCLLLFIPTIVLSVKLSTLYQKSDPYPGPLVEHEYLYDAYADRDNIPLSNSSNSKKGKKKKKHRGGGVSGGEIGVYQQQAGSSGADARCREAPGGSSHPDTRYADMAPKHWEDFPNGGPPQYQSAPVATEYERPPPYYYPGPGDRP